MLLEHSKEHSGCHSSKWKKFGTTRTLVGTEHLKEKVLGKRGDQEPDGHWLSSRDHVWRLEKLPEGKPSLQHSTNLGFMAELPDGSLVSAKACFVFAKKKKKKKST